MPNIQRIGSASARGFGFGKTGAVYFRGVTETASGVDSTVLIVGNELTVQETASVADATSVFVNYINNVVSETASGSDAVSSAPVYIATTLETASGADSISTLATNNVSATETSKISDSPSSIGTFNISTSETASGADSTAATRVSTASVSEVVIGYDEVSSLRTVSTSIAETSSGADSTSSEIGISYWMSSYYGSSTSYNQYGLSSAVDSNDNVYISGYGSTAGVTLAMILVKYSKNGVLQWQRIVDGVGTCIAYGVAVNSSGDVYIAGGYDDSSTSTSQTLQRKGVIVKYDSSGTKLWDTVLYFTPGTQSNAGLRISGITLDSSGNIYTVGMQGTTLQGLFVAKHNSSGVLQWIKKLAGGFGNNSFTIPNNARSVAINSSGNIVVAGYISYGVSTSNYSSPLIAIYDTSGNLLTKTRIADSTGSGGSRDSQFYSIALDASDNIYATGIIGDGTSSGDGCILCKYDSSANLLWAKEYYPATTSTQYPGVGVTVDSSGNPYVYLYNSYVYDDGIIFKTNSSGTTQWIRSISISGGEVLESSAKNLIKINSENDLVLSYPAYVTSSLNIAMGAKLPTDGSRTGTYTVGPITVIYAAATLTEATLLWTSQAASGTDSAPSITVLNNVMTSYNPPESSATTYI
jgi:hypothetical protein